MILTRAPLRISLFGGGTDVPEYFSKFTGHVISFTFNKFVYVAIHPRFETSFRLAYADLELADTVTDIRHPIIRNALLMKDFTKPLEIHSIADIPSAGSGLGSSSAYSLALLKALNNMKGYFSSPSQLAEEAYYLERELCKDSVGKQDHYASSFGGLNHLEFQKSGEVKVTPIIENNLVDEIEKSSILIYTGIQRSAKPLLQEQSKNILQQKTIERYHRVRDLSLEALSRFKSGDMNQIGELLHESWNLKKGFYNGVSNTAVDEIYERARNAGASGGKLLGAGGGGFIYLWVDPRKRQRVKEKLSDLISMDIRIELSGVKSVLGGLGELP